MNLTPHDRRLLSAAVAALQHAADCVDALEDVLGADPHLADAIERAMQIAWILEACADDIQSNTPPPAPRVPRPVVRRHYGTLPMEAKNR